MCCLKYYTVYARDENALLRIKPPRTGLVFLLVGRDNLLDSRVFSQQINANANEILSTLTKQIICSLRRNHLLSYILQSRTGGSFQRTGRRWG